jgi:hypothetical protein
VGLWSVIGGGWANTVGTNYSGIFTGLNNSIQNNTNSVIAGGGANTINGGDNNFIGAGTANINSSVKGGIVSGETNTASSHCSFIGSGGLGIASGDGAFIGSGLCNVSSSFYSFIGNGFSNISSGQYSFIENGFCNCATACFASISSSKEAFAYLYGQNASASGMFAVVGDAQSSYAVSRREATLNASETALMSLDGTGVTNLLLPSGNNRGWNVFVDTVIVCTGLGTGTSGGLAVGHLKTTTDSFFFKISGGVSSLSTIQNINNSHEAGMNDASVTFSVGGSGELQMTLVAPSTAGTGSTFRVVSNVRFVEVAW